ncbi:MAG: hypothetical protein AABY53_02325, partial [Bdellovibrionota bacterium]
MKHCFRWALKTMSLLSLLVCFFTQTALASPNALTFQARIVKPNGDPLEEPSIYFNLKYTDKTGACVIYEEEFAAVSMAGSKGLVTLTMGTGLKNYPPAGITLYDVFNYGTALSCQGGVPTATVTPASLDRRQLILQFNDGAGMQTLAGVSLNSVPFALHASMASNTSQLGGVAANLYTKFSDTASGGSAGVLSAADFTSFSNKQNALGFTPLNPANNLSDVANPTTSRSNLGLGTAAVLNVAAAGDAAAGEVVKGNDSRLSGGSSTLSGDVTGTVGANVVSRVGTKTSSDISTSVNDTQAATTANTANAIVRRSASGDITASIINATTFSGTNASATNVSTQNVYLYDGTNTNRIIFKAPTAGITNYTITLPAVVGTNGQVLSTNASGDLSWVNASAGSVTAVTASAPLLSSGGATPNITISIAGTSAAGAISSGDWNTFNNKQAAGSYVTTLSGDVTSSGFAAGVVTTTLANSGVVASSDYTKVTVDAKGRITSAGRVVSSDITSLYGYTPADSAAAWTLNGSGDVS